MTIKTGLLSFAATVAIAVVAHAAPRESVTYLGVNSNGPSGSAANGIGGPTLFTGAYMVSKVRISGTCTQAISGDYANEAFIQVLPPSGSGFACGPFSTAPEFVSFDVVDFVVDLPVPVAANAGAWNFRFWEFFDDGGTVDVDKVWSTVTFTLDDEVRPPPPPDQWNEATHGGSDSGELPATAQLCVGLGAVNTIVGIAAGEVDMFGIDICNPAAFSATTDLGAAWDSQLYLFSATGAGVVFNDDIAVTAPVNHTSRITGAHLFSPGRYFLAVSPFDRDPANAAGLEMWFDTPYNSERAPDGAGAEGPLSNWIGVAGAGGNYTIRLVGASFTTPGGCGGGCDTADYNNDGDTGTDLDIEAFFACLGGDCCATCPENADFNRDGDTGTDLDIEAFFRVLGGQPC